MLYVVAAVAVVYVLYKYLLSPSSPKKRVVENERAVFIEFCTSWGYAPRYAALAREIEKNLKDVLVIGNDTPPRTGAFEVTTGSGKQIWSKLQKDSFPSPDFIISELKKEGFPTRWKNSGYWTLKKVNHVLFVFFPFFLFDNYESYSSKTNQKVKNWFVMHAWQSRKKEKWLGNKL